MGTTWGLCMVYLWPSRNQFYTKGIRTTCGSTILSGLVPDEDATAIGKLKSSGAILLGKLNMSEFAMGDAFYHPYGRPHNPWGPGEDPRGFQQRLWGGHGCLSVRHIPRRGHREAL